MPRSTKKRKPNPEPEPESDSTSSSSDSDQDEESLPQENIQVDLEARSPTESDQSAVLQFLEQSFGNSIKKSVLDLHQLAAQLVNQKTCGSVFYQPLDDEDEDDDDDETLVLGISSFLQLDQPENKQLNKWFIEKCSENNQAKNILQVSKCGLFVNERYMNIPADISLPSIRSLREEIQTPIDYWIIHSKIRSPKSEPNTIYYLNGEEEVFDENSTISIEYQPNQSNANDSIEKRRILFVSTNKLDKICSDIEQKLK